MRPTIELRPHHVVCTFLFRGKGYSPDFIRNMSRTVEKLRTGAASVRIVAGKDDLCHHCPVTDCESDTAGSPEKSDPRALDTRAASQLGLTAGQEYSSLTLFEQLQELSKHAPLERMCEGCSWFEGQCKDTWHQHSLRTNATPDAEEPV